VFPPAFMPRETVRLEQEGILTLRRIHNRVARCRNLGEVIASYDDRIQSSSKVFAFTSNLALAR
jgi:hypothetical protein